MLPIARLQLASIRLQTPGWEGGGALAATLSTFSLLRIDVRGSQEAAQ